jgi:Phospholipase_D-nuclease N-terminal
MDFGYGIGGIVVLILDIWAIIKTLQSGRSGGEKLLWILLIIVLPLIGFIIWLLAGPGGRRATI